jgi:hypothetical protein
MSRPLRPCARQTHRLRAASAVVYDGNVRRSFPRSRRSKSHRDKATGSGCNAVAAGVGLGKISSVGSDEGNLGDTHGNASLVAECDLLGETLGSHRLVAEIEGGWVELHIGSRAYQTHRLRTERGVVGDGQRAWDRTRCRGPEGYGQRATASRVHGRPAVVGLSERSADRDLRNAESAQSGIAERDGLGLTVRENNLSGEREAGRRKSHGGLHSHSGKRNRLRTVGGVIGDGESGGSRAQRCGNELHGGRATGTRC